MAHGASPSLFNSLYARLMADLAATLQENLRVVPPLWLGHAERAVVEPPGDVE